MFEKSLQDLIKGLRNHKNDQAAYVSKAVAEIKRELRGTDQFAKFVAVQKSTYLHMLGVDVGFAAFNIVEVMSAPRFAHRRAGLLAAAQVFDKQTEVVLLCTNLLKKQLHEANQYEQGCALNCLSNIATKALARDLLEDVASLLSSSRPFVRKKAILTLYKLYLVYPQGLALTFDRLRAKLEDTDQTVVSCAVNVICELSRKNPRNFLAMAPQLFHLMTSSTNNWMLIKIVKLMAALIPEEPRLARKLLEPLGRVIETTMAKSLLYECISTATLALAFSAREDGSQPKCLPSIVELCTNKLREFVEDSDQNLKYLGLVGFVNLMRSHPRVVAEHREMVLKCLIDDDVTVRLRALELLTGMVTKRNLVDIVQKLIEHLMIADGTYRDEIVDKIIFVCSRDRYAYLSDFNWYISVLVDLAYLKNSSKGLAIRRQLIDLCARVPSVRPFAVSTMASLLLNDRLVQRRGEFSQTESISHVLFAAGWIVCEYSSFLGMSKQKNDDKPLLPPFDDQSIEGGDDQQQEQHASLSLVSCPEFAAEVEGLVAVLLAPSVHELAPFVQAAFAHNVLKLVAAVCAREISRSASWADAAAGRARLEALAQLVVENLSTLSRSQHSQVQERAVMAIEILVCCGLATRPDQDNNKINNKIPAQDSGENEEVAQFDLLSFTSVEGTTRKAQINRVAAGTTTSDDIVFLSQAHKRLGCLFETQLTPVALQAQSMVTPREGLNIDDPIRIGDTSSESNSFPTSRVGGARMVSFRLKPAFSPAVSQPGLSIAEQQGAYQSENNKAAKVVVGGKAGPERRNDPFYLTSTTQDNEQATDSEEDEDKTPLFRLNQGELGQIRSSFMFSRDYRNTFIDRDSEHAENVILDEAMPQAVPSQPRIKSKLRTPGDHEDLTLADINLALGDESSTNPPASQSYVVTAPESNLQSADKPKSKDKKAKKASKELKKDKAAKEKKGKKSSKDKRAAEPSAGSNLLDL